MRFEEKKDHYLDTKTGLKWSKENIGPVAWKDAMTSLPEGWRLPTVKELLSIVDDAKHDPATELPGILSSYYWSSTTDARNPYDAWSVDFYDGYDYWRNKSSNYYVRAVRGRYHEGEVITDYEKARELGLTNINRWEDGIDHHPMSERLMKFLAEHDFNDYEDHFCWKIGGDGDNGEGLMYQMDAFFELLDVLDTREEV